MANAAVHDSTEQPVQTTLRSSGSTSFYLWVLITFSSGIVMAQDTWYNSRHPRFGTEDATATFTKVLVIHSVWLAVSLGFVIFAWLFRPTAAWKLHIAVGLLACFWTAGVLVFAFNDVERLQVSTWKCTSAPTEPTLTDEFLATCSLVDTDRTIRMGSNIYLWSPDDKHFWRWIVPGDDRVTLQTQWSTAVTGIYMSSATDGAELLSGSTDSMPGKIWSASFDPHRDRSFRLFFIEAGDAENPGVATPVPITFSRPNREVAAI